MFIVTCFFLLNACSSFKSKKSENQNHSTVIENMGDFISIYKTKNNYSQKVPVKLSDDKNYIVSYPDPSDLFLETKALYPIKLKNNYLLSQVGIGKNYAFLDYSYEEYRELKDITAEKLFDHIIDFDPFTEVYECNTIGGVEEINEKISSNGLKSFCK